MPVTGGGVIAENIKKFGAGFQAKTKKIMGEVVDILDYDITQHMNISDHTLKELAELGHPYASRHGSRGLPIHDPYWIIHTQGGRLLSSKKKGVSDVGIVNGQLKVTGWVGLDETVAYYALYVIWGTSKMIPRDPLSGSLFDANFQTKAKEHLRANLRNLVVNFRGVETR